MSYNRQPAPRHRKLPPTFLTKSADYTITSVDAANDLYISCTATQASPATFTLPLANSVAAGKKIYLIATSSSDFPDLNAKSSGTDKIYGLGLPTSGVTDIYPNISAYCSWIVLTSDGSSKWIVFGNY
jgi:hypothetical protein